MPVAVIQPQPKKDPLDTIVKGLQIASSVYGIRQAQAILDQKDEAAQAKKDEDAGVVNPMGRLKLKQMGFTEVPEGTPGAQVIIASEDPSKKIYINPPTSKDDFMNPYQKEQLKFEREKLAQQNALEREKIAAAANKEKTKYTTGAEAAQIGAFDSALSTIDDLGDSWNTKASGTGSGVFQFFKGTDANKYSNERKQAAQTIGRVLEGGKLSDQDVGRYEQMLPGGEDSTDQARNKAISLKKKIVAQRNAQIKGLGDAGFDVSGFSIADTKNIDTPIGKKSKKITSQPDTAIAAPALKSADEMTNDELDAEIAVRKKGK